MATEKSAAEMAVELEEAINDPSSGGMRKVLKDAESEEGQEVEKEVEKVEPDKVEKVADVKAADQQSRAEVEEEAPIDGGEGKKIPYSVLKATRLRVHELETQIENLKKQEVKPEVTQAAAVETPDDEFADLPEALVKKIRALEKQVEDAKSEISGVKQHVSKREERENTAAANETQTLIDANPVLAKWQAEGGEVWKAAQEADSRLAMSPVWKDKPLADRFAKVAQIVATEFDITLPSAQKPVPTEKKPAARAAVTSISDLSGGGQPALDGHDSIENSSAAGLAVQWSQMNKGDLQKLLRETG